MMAGDFVTDIKAIRCNCNGPIECKLDVDHDHTLIWIL